MLPYTWIIFLACCVTFAYGLPATTTPAPETTPTAISRLDIGDIIPALECLRTGFQNPEHASPTASVTTPSANIVARQQTIPAYTPIVTPAPDQAEKLASLGYYQTTYYACNVVGGKELCGWHIPIMKAGAGRIGERTEVLLGLVLGLVIFWILL